MLRNSNYTKASSAWQTSDSVIWVIYTNEGINMIWQHESMHEQGEMRNRFKTQTSLNYIRKVWGWYTQQFIWVCDFVPSTKKILKFTSSPNKSVLMLLLIHLENHCKGDLVLLQLNIYAINRRGFAHCDDTIYGV